MENTYAFFSSFPTMSKRYWTTKARYNISPQDTITARGILPRRTLDYAVALEGSLKLKEISYIHSEAYAAGELKHGTIALIENGTVVVALCTVKKLFDKMLSNIKEVKARGAVVIAVAEEGHTEIEQEADYVIYVPKIDELAMPSEVVIPLQLFSIT